jgi:hypothetical protein
MKLPRDMLTIVSSDATVIAERNDGHSPLEQSRVMSVDEATALVWPDKGRRLKTTTAFDDLLRELTFFSGSPRSLNEHSP